MGRGVSAGGLPDGSRELGSFGFFVFGCEGGAAVRVNCGSFRLSGLARRREVDLRAASDEFEKKGNIGGRCL
jgi:hypothetical protein